MEKKVKRAICEYQCSGCSKGHNLECFEENPVGGVGCGGQSAGTYVAQIGNIFLGLPKGFNRLGHHERMVPTIFESFDKFEWGPYDKFNVAVWKHLTKEGHTLVRGLMPRRNEPFLHIFLENCINKIDCAEITEEEIVEMD